MHRPSDGKTVKKALAACLSVVFVLLPLGAWMSGQLALKELKEAKWAYIAAGKANGYASTISLSRADYFNPHVFHWVHSKEFVLRGQMYDIVSLDSSGEDIEIVALLDHDEMRLMAFIGQLQNSAGDNFHPPTRKHINFPLLFPPSPAGHLAIFGTAAAEGMPQPATVSLSGCLTGVFQPPEPVLYI